MTRALAITLLAFGAILGICFLRYTPPSPRGLDTPLDQFSSARARATLVAIAGDSSPRDIGSAGNARARAWLEAELGRTGWKTEIQTAMSCSHHGACARVNNVVATRAGTEPDAAPVLLMAHYDSVPCGPGASDDGMGTATVIEVARAISRAAPLRRMVVLVLTDGEEAGLLGATAFVRAHPLGKRAHGAINVDARGTAGPSAMFETSAGNAWLIGLLARHTERPVTSSLFYEIYRRMPNDTDFTAVKELAHGVNFANIARVERYHTPLDSLEHADAGTLQHHGDQALAMVRALADAGPELDAPHDPSRDAVWFDVLALFVVRWPASASLGLALAATALVLGWAIRMRAWGAGLSASVAGLVAALVTSLLIGFVLRAAGAVPVPWVAHPLPALLALHGSSMLAGLAVAALVARRSSAKAAWAGTWLTWGGLGVLSALLAPGASFLFVVPTLIAGMVAWLRIDVAAAIPALAAAVLWMPIAILVYDGLGLIMPVLASISSTLLVTTVPALASTGRAAGSTPWNQRAVVAAAAGVGVTAIVASLIPKYSEERPQRVNVVVRQEHPERGALPPSRIYVQAAWAYMPWGTPPKPMLAALGDPSRVGAEAPTPWSAAVPFVKSLPLALPAPRATLLDSRSEGATRIVTVALRSSRGARTIAIVLPAERRPELEVEGQRPIPRDGALVFRGVPDDGVQIELRGEGRGPIALTLLDISQGLPERRTSPTSAEVDAHAVRAARRPEAAQTQDGDVTIVSCRLEL